MLQYLRSRALPVAATAAFSLVLLFWGSTIACSHGNRDLPHRAGDGDGGIDAGDGVITPPPGPLSGPVNVWQVLDAPPLADHGRAMAAAFGLDGTKTEVIEENSEAIELSDGAANIVVYASGSYEYTRSAVNPSAVPPAAPTRDEAIAIAKTFLLNADTKLAGSGSSSYADYKLTPEQSIFIVSGAGIDMAQDDFGNDIGPLDPMSDTTVMFEPALAVQPPNLSLPVAGAEISAKISYGQVSSVRSAWRPAKQQGTITPRTQDRLVEWLKSLQDMVSSTVDDLLPQYYFPNETDRVGFLAPMYAVPYAPLNTMAVPPGAPGAPGAPGMRLKHGVTTKTNGVATFPEPMPATSWNVDLAMVGDVDDQPSSYHIGFEVSGGNWGVAQSDLKYKVTISSDLQGLVFETQLNGSRMSPTCGAPAVAPPVDPEAGTGGPPPEDGGDAAADAGDAGDAAPLYQLPAACLGWDPGDGTDPFGIPLIAEEVAPVFFDAYLPLVRGLHTLQVTVTDQNTNVVTGVFLAHVVRSTASPLAAHDADFEGPAKAWPISKMHRVGPIVVDVIPGQTLYPPRAAPIFKKFRRSNWDAKWGSVVDSIDMPHWRYSLMYELDYGKKYIYYDSSKCVSGQYATAKDDVEGTTERIQCGACERPADILDADNNVVKFARPTVSPDLMYQKLKAPTPLAGNVAKNQTLDQFESTVTFDNLPGSLEMKFKYQAAMTMCAPDYPGRLGSTLRGVNSAAGAVRPMNTGLGRCEGLVPEVDWRYSFDPVGTDCKLLQKMCAIPGGATKGPCRIETNAAADHLPKPATQADIDALCPAAEPDKKLKVVRAYVDIYTRYAFGGSRMNPTFIKDERGQAPKFDYTWGQALIPDPGAAYKPGHPAVFIPPMPFESIGDYNLKTEPNRGTTTTTLDRHYDNVHIKQVRDCNRTLFNNNQQYLPEFLNYTYPAFPGGNSQMTWDDQAPCFHLHEHWNTVKGVKLIPNIGGLPTGVSTPDVNDFGTPSYNDYGPGAQIRYSSVLDKYWERNTVRTPEELVDDKDAMGKLQPVDWTNPSAFVSATYAEWKVGSVNGQDPAAYNMHVSHGGERIAPKSPYREPSGKKIVLWGRVSGAVQVSMAPWNAGFSVPQTWDDGSNYDYRPKYGSWQSNHVAGAKDWKKTHLAPAWASPDVMKGVFTRGHEVQTK